MVLNVVCKMHAGRYEKVTTLPADKPIFEIGCNICHKFGKLINMGEVTFDGSVCIVELVQPENVTVLRARPSMLMHRLTCKLIAILTDKF